MRTGKVLFVMVAVLAMAGIAMAQDVPVANGDFETPEVDTPQHWNIYDSGTDGLGWTVEWYGDETSYGGQTRPAPAHLEIHENGAIGGVTAYDGDQYVELDTDWDGPGKPLSGEPASVYIYQNIPTCYGADYVLTFHYTQRPGSVSSLGVYVNDSLEFSDSPTGGFNWIEETVPFTATGATTKIGFKEEGNPDSYGVFLDGVTVEQVSDCGSTVTLCEAQYYGIGNVYVYNDADYIYVEFTINSDEYEYSNRYLNEVHVAVVSNPADFPTVGKNNPVPGQFPYSCDDYDPITPMDTMCTARVPFSEIGGCGPVYIAAHASVIQVDGDGCSPDPQGGFGEATQWATQLIDYFQGTQVDGEIISIKTPLRDDPNDALGVPDGGLFCAGESDGWCNFFSLGFIDGSSEGGYISVGFGAPIYNGEGPDICVQETSPRTAYPPEIAYVYGLSDGLEIYLGMVTNEVTSGTTVPVDGFSCVDIPDEFSTFDAVKIVDMTDPNPFLAKNDLAADAYDVDAIGACYLYEGDETAWGAACEPADGILFNERGNWGTYFAFTPACLD